MRDQALFLEAAKCVKRNADAVTNTTEQERIEKQYEELKQRAATILDKLFSRFSSPTFAADKELRRGFHGQENNDCKLTGEAVTTIRGEHPDHPEYLRRIVVTRCWVRLSVPAGEEYDDLAPEGYRVRKRLLIGTHDVQSSDDGGKSWGETQPAASLDVVSGLFIEPLNGDMSDLDDGEVRDPFEYGPIILERLNRGHPVFKDKDDTCLEEFLQEPELHHYDTPEERIAAFHGVLDDFEKALG